MSFSLATRQQVLDKLATETYDLLIIGGGVTGVGIALDAASRGLKTILVEKNDFAYGTSSRSTKLIHGGLRYLKQFEFALVKEVGSERAIVHNIAPHLVLAEKMLLPLSEGRGLGVFLTSFGLKLYDWLAGVKLADQRRMLTRKKTLRTEPLLRKEGIKGGGLYAEYRTDDARLTIELAKTAAKLGAQLLSYVQAKSFLYENEKVVGASVEDILTNQKAIVKAKAVINATGPWVDELRELDKSKNGKTLHLTKGVHIVLTHRKFPISQAIYFDVPDGRMIFAIPRGKTTYIGTTDTDYTHDIDAVSVSKADATYLLDAVKETFPTIQLTLSDIESSWAGLRPLIHEEGKSASELSRKDEIFVSPSGLFSIAGGKLTGYRKMAERVVTLVAKKHFSERKLHSCFTHKIKVTGGDFKSSKEVRTYILSIKKRMLLLKQEEYMTRYLVHTYGKQTDSILNAVNIYFEKGLDPDSALMLAELHFGLEHEMVLTPQDFFNRRTSMMLFDTVRLNTFKGLVLKEFQKYFQWTDQRLMEEKLILEKEIYKINHFID
jgi:glycerol-3-phosphate dehydrogenase